MCWIVGVRLKFISLVIIENHIFTRGYATHENIAFYDHSWNKFLFYTNIQQISSIYSIYSWHPQTHLLLQTSGYLILFRQKQPLFSIIIDKYSLHKATWVFRLYMTHISCFLLQKRAIDAHFKVCVRNYKGAFSERLLLKNNIWSRGLWGLLSRQR